MAVEILILAKDGPDRKAGTIIDIKECPDGEHCVWGKSEGPPTFHLIRIDGIGKKDLPPSWLEYGGHKSRGLFDKKKVSLTAQSQLDKQIRVKVPLTTAKKAIADTGKDWQPVDLTAEG